jgi:hypothetical protein
VDAQYQVDRTVDAKADDEIGTALARLAREGARLMLEQALAAEVDEFLGRQRYTRRPSSGATATAISGLARWPWAPGPSTCVLRECRTCRPEARPSSRGSCPSSGGSPRRPSSCSPSSTWRASRVGTSSRSSGSCSAKRRPCRPTNALLAPVTRRGRDGAPARRGDHGRQRRPGPDDRAGAGAGRRPAGPGGVGTRPGLANGLRQLYLAGGTWETGRRATTCPEPSMVLRVRACRRHGERQ